MKEFFSAKKTCVAVTVALASVSLFTGCDDRDVAIGLGSAAIGAGAAAIIIGNNNNGGYNNGGYRNVCSTYYDYYGRPYQDCRQVYGRYYRENANGREAGVIDSANAAALTPEDFAAEFHLSFESSTRLVSAFKTARAGSNAELLGMGLKTEDLNQMAQFNLPQSSSIDALAKNLNVDVASTTGMLNRMRTWALTEQNKKCEEFRFSFDAKEKEFYETYCN